MEEYVSWNACVRARCLSAYRLKDEVMPTLDGATRNGRSARNWSYRIGASRCLWIAVRTRTWLLGFS